MTELATAPPELTPITPETLEVNEGQQHDITAMSNAALLDEAHNFNLHYQDRNYFPSGEEQEFLKSIAHSIEMSDQGAISYSLRGEKLKPVEARTFLDNVINMEREAADPTYERKTRGTMQQDVAGAALGDFREYIQEEYALGPKVTRKTAEVLDKAVRATKYLGEAALRATVLVAQTGVKAAVQSGKAVVEVSKFAGKHSKKAVKAAHEKAGAAASVLMEPSVPDPSWLDFVREANAAEQEAAEPGTRSQPGEPSGVSAETSAIQGETKKSTKVRKLGKIALKGALVAGSAYYLKRRGKHSVS